MNPFTRRQGALYGGRSPRSSGFSGSEWNRFEACGFRVDIGLVSGVAIRGLLRSTLPGMSIEDELQNELHDAMRGRDRPRLAAIRSVQTEIARFRSQPGFTGMVDDDVCRKVIGSYVKRIAKAPDEFGAAGDRGRVQAERLAYEIEYLGQWLPKALGEDETRELVRAAIAALGVSDPNQTGRIIGHVMKSGAEGVDGGLVSRLVREELGTG